MSLDPKRLAVLAAVIRTGSMSEAARELQYSPAAVSQHVAALERQVGVALLIRHARGVRPTAAGALLARHAGAVADRLELAERELAELLDGRGGTVELGIFASATVGALPSALSWFARRHPRVRVAVSEYDAVPSVEALRAGTLDVALTFDTPDAPELDRSGLEVVAVGRDAMLALLPAADPRADEDEIALGDLRHEPWILPRGDTCARLVERSCRREGFEPRVTLTTDDHAAARSLVAEGMGVALVPQLLRQRDDAAVVVRPVRPAPVREVLVAVREDGTSSPAALGLRDAFVASSAA